MQMLLKKFFTTLFCFYIACSLINAQEEVNSNEPPVTEPQNQGGRISGSLETNVNFFMKDEKIGASGTPQYERQQFGTDSWLNLNYSNWGFDFTLRYDMFNNSYLLNPTSSYSAQGIGMWSIRKKIDKLGIQVGYIYDQIGSGMIFRAFEERPLAIDNALVGGHLTYEFNKNWKIKGFVGKQKQQFSLYNSLIKGGAIDGFIEGKNGKWTCAPGFGVSSRQYDDETMNQIVSAITTYTPVDSIGACYSTYAFSAYNTLSAGDFTWYVEGAIKSKDVFNDPFATKTQWTGSTSTGKLVQRPGNVIYTSLSYVKGDFGINLEAKRTENFNYRATPFTKLFQGAVNFLPSMARQNTYRLTARYQAATQDLGEQAFQADVRYNLTDKIGLNVNVSNITRLNNEQLYRELYSEVTYKHSKKLSFLGGLQLQYYNQQIYETKPGVPIVKTIVPYAEMLYKFTRKNSLRVELSYMDCHQDYGSWLFGLAEYSIAPHWIFTCSGMYNSTPKKTADILYPTIGATYIKDSNRFAISYVKQVQGIVCSGGICRFEPAFRGVNMNISSTF